MASRLLCRYARLLCRASSQAPAAAAASRLPPLGAGAAELQRAKGWPWVSDRLMCDANLKENKRIILPERTKLDNLVENAETPEDILAAWAANKGNANQAANALMRWTQLVLKTTGKFEEHRPEDSRLQNMMEVLRQHVSSVWNNNLVSALRSLWIIDVPPTDSVLGSVHNEVLWRVRRLSCKQLVQVVDSGAYRKGQQDVMLVSSAVKQLELRWTEIADAKTVTALISKGGRLTPTLMEKLEDKALELAESFSAEEIRKVFLSLAAQNRRSIPLLRALSYHLLQKPSSEFTVPLMMDATYTYGKLNFNQTQVFQRIAAELLPTVPDLSPVDVMRCAKSLGFLKWLHIPLFQAFADHYSANHQKYNPVQLCNLLMTFARLGFQANRGEEIYNKVRLALEESLSELSPFLQTDAMWSLCVLEQAKPDYLIAVLQPNHVSKLLEGSPRQVASYKLKLLHIAATLRLEHPGCSDPGSVVVPYVRTSKSTLTVLQNSLREALQTLVDGKTEALRTGVSTVYGWDIDVEMVVDCDNKPVDLLPLKAPHLQSGGGDQALPAGARRLAFLAWEFPNFGSKSRDLLGQFAMKKRHLQLAGFIIVEVPFYEFLDLKSDRQKLAYLKDKMGKAVAEDMAK